MRQEIPIWPLVSSEIAEHESPRTVRLRPEARTVVVVARIGSVIPAVEAMAAVLGVVVDERARRGLDAPIQVFVQDGQA
jgi:hypothetical protein